MQFNNDLEIFVSRQFFNNSYLLKQNDKCIVIDPSFSDEKIAKYIKDNKLILMGIILTHSHFDHIGNAFELAKLKNCQIYIYLEEKVNFFENNLSEKFQKKLKIDEKYLTFFKENNLIINDFKFTIYHTPGHTSGGICLVWKNFAFTGDTLFYDSIGRTDLITGNEQQMKNSLEFIARNFKDNCQILPGHGRIGTFNEIKHKNKFLNYNK